jgi:hypothetical protein
VQEQVVRHDDGAQDPEAPPAALGVEALGTSPAAAARPGRLSPLLHDVAAATTASSRKMARSSGRALPRQQDRHATVSRRPAPTAPAERQPEQQLQCHHDAEELRIS